MDALGDTLSLVPSDDRSVTLVPAGAAVLRLAPPLSCNPAPTVNAATGLINAEVMTAESNELLTGLNTASVLEATLVNRTVPEVSGRSETPPVARVLGDWNCRDLICTTTLSKPVVGSAMERILPTLRVGTVVTIETSTGGAWARSTLLTDPITVSVGFARKPMRARNGCGAESVVKPFVGRLMSCTPTLRSRMFAFAGV